MEADMTKNGPFSVECRVGELFGRCAVFNDDSEYTDYKGAIHVLNSKFVNTSY